MKETQIPKPSDAPNYVCHNCIGEGYLSAEIKATGTHQECSYCGKRARCYSIARIAERVDIAFQQHYRRTADQPDAFESALLADEESTYEWDREGESSEVVIAEALEAEHDVAKDVQTILAEQYADFEAAQVGDETEYATNAHYEEAAIGDERWQERWDEFERSLLAEARFFNRAAAQHLTSVFEGLELLKTHDDKPLIVAAGPRTALASLFRARVFQSRDKLLEGLTRPDVHVGTPPSMLAVAGRMNARGIAVFYGASSADVAITEVRPPVGSNVVVARFDILRKLQLLDLTALEIASSTGSIFDPKWVDVLSRLTFLRSLARRVARPVMPDDEAFQYLPTQAIADFLATDNRPPLDGILFPSVQAGEGLNAVLFHKAARVEALALPPETKLEARDGHDTQDGWEIDYEVVEEVPAIEKPKKGAKRRLPQPDFDFGATARAEQGDDRPATLRVDLSSVEVHSITSVSFNTVSHGVRRWRSDRSPHEGYIDF